MKGNKDVMMPIPEGAFDNLEELRRVLDDRAIPTEGRMLRDHPAIVFNDDGSFTFPGDVTFWPDGTVRTVKGKLMTQREYERRLLPKPNPYETALVVVAIAATIATTYFLSAQY